MFHHADRGGSRYWGHADGDGGRHRGDVVQVHPLRGLVSGACAGTRVSATRRLCGHGSLLPNAVLLALASFSPCRACLSVSGIDEVMLTAADTAVHKCSAARRPACTCKIGAPLRRMAVSGNQLLTL